MIMTRKMTNFAAAALGAALAAMVALALARAIHMHATVRPPSHARSTAGAAPHAFAPHGMPARRRGNLACGSVRLDCNQLEMLLPE
jgi:hypothetical protein